MSDKNGNLYLFEAIELRNEYDRHIKLLEDLMGESRSKRDRLFSNSNSDEEQTEPAADFDQKGLEEKLKKLQTKRVKLNQAIQMANFKAQIDYNGENVSIAEALEIRKNLLADNEAISQRALSAAYKRIIHKEERDIVHEPRHFFQKTYEDFQDNLKKLRHMVNQIHIVNHKATVVFKDE